MCNTVHRVSSIDVLWGTKFSLSPDHHVAAVTSSGVSQVGPTTPGSPCWADS